MIDAIIVAVMTGAVLTFAGVTWIEVRTEERRVAREEAERQAERDRALEMLRDGVAWAMAHTPRDWVR